MHPPLPPLPKYSGVVCSLFYRGANSHCESRLDEAGPGTSVSEWMLVTILSIMNNDSDDRLLFSIWLMASIVPDWDWVELASGCPGSIKCWKSRVCYFTMSSCTNWGHKCRLRGRIPFKFIKFIDIKHVMQLLTTTWNHFMFLRNCIRPVLLPFPALFLLISPRSSVFLIPWKYSWSQFWLWSKTFTNIPRVYSVV